ncbi:MAG: capsular biosynthesis protein [Betaproteobacteria bacterium]
MSDSLPQRQFLFLQGPTNYLFADVAKGLRARGHAAHRINFCLGDQLFWRGPGAVDFRARWDAWPAFIADFLQRHAITDLVLLGEQRELHRTAIAAARLRNIRVTVTDFGYIRPDWVIVELNGMNADSLFPRDPQMIREIAADLPAIDREVRYRDSFFNQALLDMAFHLSSALWPWTFPHFKRHTLRHPILIYLGVGLRLALGGIESRRAMGALAIVAARGPHFLFAMQTEDDYSLRAYSPYPDLDAPMREAIQSFARHAPAAASLVFKLHPLDPGLKAWRRRIARMAREAGVAERVFYIDGGDLDQLINSSSGVITVNSTVGLRAIELRRPIIALGDAIYRVPGITFMEPLDKFWTDAHAPDAALAESLLRALAATLHVRGGYYTREGVDAAAAGMIYRLHHGKVNQPLVQVVRGEALGAS